MSRAIQTANGRFGHYLSFKNMFYLGNLTIKWTTILSHSNHNISCSFYPFWELRHILHKLYLVSEISSWWIITCRWYRTYYMSYIYLFHTSIFITKSMFLLVDLPHTKTEMVIIDWFHSIVEMCQVYLGVISEGGHPVDRPRHRKKQPVKLCEERQGLLWSEGSKAACPCRIKRSRCMFVCIYLKERCYRINKKYRYHGSE